ncbi:MAG: DNA-3-methyladenine glycosylase [Bacteroidota bacterium]
MKLEKEFYTRSDVVLVSRELLGKYLFTRFEGRLTGGIITETEAYAGVTDRASHAYGGRRTKRTEVMYSEGGTAYVYLCYGIHHLFNIVTNKPDVPHAVLIRAVKPEIGIETILERRKQTVLHAKTAGGPGTVSQALGITTRHTGVSLLGNEIWLEDRGVLVMDDEITAGPRIGVDYAGKDARLPYRFFVRL